MNRTDSTSLIGNDISGNTHDGINLFNGVGNTINNNLVNGNSGSGISVSGGTSAVRIYANITRGNGQYGINNESLGQVFSNTSQANGLFDLSGVVCGGDNVFFTNDSQCIH
jgi:parallel beta-helix repeat protein